MSPYGTLAGYPLAHLWEKGGNLSWNHFLLQAALAPKGAGACHDGAVPGLDTYTFPGWKLDDSLPACCPVSFLPQKFPQIRRTKGDSQALAHPASWVRVTEPP